MLQAVKRLVGAERGEDFDRAISDAAAKLERARRALETEQGKVAALEAAVSQATAAFYDEASEGAADAVVDAKRRHDRAQLFAERAAKAVDEASQAVAKVEQARDEAELARVSELCTPAAVQRELQALVALYGDPMLASAIALFDSVGTLHASTVAALRDKVALLHKLGADAIATEGELAVAQGAVPHVTMARLVGELIRSQPLGWEKTRWLGEV